MNIFLEPDIQETESKLKDFVQKYNDKLKSDPQFCESEFHKHLTNNTEGIKQTPRSLAIKPMVLVSALQVVKFYHSHLKALSTTGRPSSAGDFKINNQALSTRLIYCKGTSHRHLDRLIVAGIMKDYVFRGSNSGFELRVNNRLLVARKDMRFTDMLIEQAKMKAEDGVVDIKVINSIYKLRPSFIDYPNGYYTTWSYIATNTLGLKKNNNIEIQGIVKNLNNSNNASSQQPDQVLNNDSIECPENRTTQELPLEQSELPNFKKYAKIITPSYQQNNSWAVDNERKLNNLPAKIRGQIDFYIERSFIFAKNVLWPDEILTNYQAKAIIDFLLTYYIYATTLQHKTPPLRKFFTEFAARIQISRDYVKRQPNRFIMQPSLYFTHESSGFRGTKPWYIKSRKKQQQKTEWNQNQRKVAHLFIKYQFDKTTDNYLKAVQQLGKLHDKSHLELFNKCVLEPQEFNHESFNQSNKAS